MVLLEVYSILHIIENSVETAPCTEQGMEETLKRTEDLSNSVEEDHQDEDICTRRRVRGTGSFVLCFNISFSWRIYWSFYSF